MRSDYRKSSTISQLNSLSQSLERSPSPKSSLMEPQTPKMLVSRQKQLNRKLAMAPKIKTKARRRIPIAFYQISNQTKFNPNRRATISNCGEQNEEVEANIDNNEHGNFDTIEMIKFYPYENKNHFDERFRNLHQTYQRYRSICRNLFGNEDFISSTNLIDISSDPSSPLPTPPAPRPQAINSTNYLF